MLGTTYSIAKGVIPRIQEIDDAIPHEWIEAVTDPQIDSQGLLTGWWAFFHTPDSVPSYARFGDIFFQVCPDLRLRQMAPAFPFTFGTWHRIRVVGSKGKKHSVDPDIDLYEVPLWTLWIWEGRPLSRLSWDLGEWLWPTVCGFRSSSFLFSVDCADW